MMMDPGMHKMFGVMSIVHATVLLTASFFVLVVASKVDQKKLKTFGSVVAVLLWISSAVILGKGIYKMCKYHCNMNKMMRGECGMPGMKGKKMHPRMERGMMKMQEQRSTEAQQ